MSKNDVLRHLKVLLLQDDADYMPITRFFPGIFYVSHIDKKKFTFLNQDKVCECLGYSLEDMEGWDDDLKNLVFDDDSDMVTEELKNFIDLKDDEDYSYNSRLKHKEGNWRYFRTRGTVLKRSDKGKPLSLMFVAEDVTEKMKCEEEAVALRNLIEETEELLEYGSWSWNLQVDKVYWTNGMFSIFDYKRHDAEALVSNEFLLKHLPEKEALALSASFAKSIENKDGFQYTHTIITSTGQQKIVITKGKALTGESGEVVKLIGTTSDITVQTSSTKDLIHYREMMMEKEEFMNQGSWETDINNGHTTWSKGMFRLFGYDESEMKHVNVTKDLHFSHMSEEEIQRSKEDWQLILREKDNYSREATIITKDGLSKQLETYGKVIRNSQGVAEKVIGTTRDVTRLREYERGLEGKINELNRSNAELEDFAYIASHDLQEPLRKLTTFSERLQAKFREVLGSEGAMYLSRIVAATENMRILIDNLLEFSKTARSPRHFARMDLNHLLEDVKAELELKIEETGTEIFSVGLPVIEVIPSQIKQLFNNLLNNSIKFKRPEIRSLISITCEKLDSNQKKSYKLRIDRNYYKISFADNGIGFESEYSERIFQIFQRLHGKSEYPGSGIGLAICKKIVDNHNGVIFATAYPEQGAVFIVILPETQSV